MYRKLAKKILKLANSLSRSSKRSLLMVTDCLIFSLTIYLAFYLRLNLSLEYQQIRHFWGEILGLIAIKVLVFYLRGIYRPVVRYTGLEFLASVLQAVLYSSGVLISLAYFQGDAFLPRSVLIIDALLTLVLVIGVRLLIRSVFHRLNIYVSSVDREPTIVIYGAGVVGCQLARSLQNDPHYRLLAFVDDNPDLQQRVIQGIRVYSPSQLALLHQKRSFDWVILAIPNVAKAKKRQIIESLETLPIVIKTVPPLSKILSGEAAINQIRSVDVSELLGREEILPHAELLGKNVTGKAVLVTGGGGSIGSELCRQIAFLKPKCLVIYELNEFSLYKIDLDLSENYADLRKYAYLGNVLDRNHLARVIQQHQIETIYHTAAYKHVPLVEANASQGIYTNVWGTLNVAQTAIENSVSNLVLISTDKAVRPTNIMGASKRCAELVVQALAALPDTSTCCAIVRFGNVLDSSGSVVPRFREQIAQRKNITLTHRDIIRYFMSIPEAVRLVMQAGAMAKGGEVFLLDMGEPVRIYDLALQMIRLSGLELGQDIDIEITGLRPGEKLYEELLIDTDKARPTAHPKIFCAHEHFLAWEKLQIKLEQLLNYIQVNDRQGLVKSLQDLVPEYRPPQQIASSLSSKK
ncbi:MAG: polysaccharide biosynthesis protein [Microcystis sp. M048S1]|uniref:polysaccharide biosynthesis protein n=1 Tax=unclassified Microcystis TaxID=2643300 RepID=UPI001193F7A4|nr:MULTISPECIES: nucleoside-diphosphate sugar epimerase/dehydratase [unclassified Microcystis]MCA2900066.1 polysaccharide biosynthesis protein [Microcystis sp. M035S1]MCA2723350.1 polysaccharide biosynthesis protein [Microcystis sp. M176S2]MCA2726811.1 polysaccharide biosynthesis protein [Microcystis sp. M166S2]MCA2728389.1 polysaccharide biosynthesis protein [Microcystis sp. M162S2]MCA2745842.1 polysaccharide biosynthesis protein [Microcystis sp. M155S2]